MSFICSEHTLEVSGFNLHSLTRTATFLFAYFFIQVKGTDHHMINPQGMRADLYTDVKYPSAK